MSEHTVPKKRHKILFLITKGSWGGAQQYVFDLATHLPYEAYDPLVAIGGTGLLKDKLDSAGIRTVSIGGLKRDISFSDELKATGAIFKLIRKERPTILHLNSTKASFLGAIIGRLLRVPVIIYTAHGWAFNEDRPGWVKWIAKCVHWLTILAAHQTIAVSNGMVKQFTWPGVQRKITVIHPGRDISTLLSREDARGLLETRVQNAITNLHDFESDIWIGSIAELHPTKQLHRLIGATAAVTQTFPNVRLVLIHDGDERARLEQQVKDLGLEAHVFFTGTLENAARFLPAFDIFALPSRSEAFGYVLVEAGVAGVPVIATNVGGIPDILTDKVTGLLIPPHDTPSLSAALKTLIADQELRQALATAHRQNVARFSVDTMLTATTELYQKLILR